MLVINWGTDSIICSSLPLTQGFQQQRKSRAGGERVTAEEPGEPCSQPDQISLLPPQAPSSSPLCHRDLACGLALPITSGSRSWSEQGCSARAGKGTHLAPCSHVPAILSFNLPVWGRELSAWALGKACRQQLSWLVLQLWQPCAHTWAQGRAGSLLRIIESLRLEKISKVIGSNH